MKSMRVDGFVQRWLRLVLVGLAAFALVAAAAPPSAIAAPPLPAVPALPMAPASGPLQPAEEGDPLLVEGISGTITDADGNPLAGAWVCADTECTYGDGDGAYSIDWIPAGSYLVKATLEAYLATYYATSGSVLEASAATEVAVTDQVGAADIDIALVKAAKITGAVTISTGPVAYPTVCTTDGKYCTNAEIDGNYTLYVPAGTYKVRASLSDGGFTMTGTSAEFTLANGDNQVADITLAEGTGLRGTVKGGIAGSWTDVKVYRLTGGVEELVASGGVSSGGSYSFRNLAAGSYVVRFTSDANLPQCYLGATCTPISVAENTVVGLEDVTMVAREPGSLAGVVLDGASQPLAGVTVAASGSTGNYEVTTDADGRWKIDSLASGISWQLALTKQGYTSEYRWASPKESRTTDLGKVRLHQLGKISGTVTNDLGAGVGEVWVYTEGLDSHDYGQAKTDSEGKFTLSEVKPGHYRIWLNAPAEYLSLYYPGVLDSEDAALVAVGEGATATVSVGLVKSATISGAVTGSGDQSVNGGAEVISLDRDWSRWAEVTDGAYQVEGLIPGDYTVLFNTDDYTETWLGGAKTKAGATRLSLDPGEVAAADLKFPASSAKGRFSGTVKIAGVPARALVTLVNEDGEYNSNSELDGTFSFAAPPGSYDLRLASGGTTICGTGYTAECTSGQVVLTIAETTQLDLEVAALGSLSGVITGPSGQGVVGAYLYLQDASGRQVAWLEAETDGSYAIDGLAAGDYTLEIESPLISRSVPVTVAGATTKDVQLAAYRSISGKVTVPSGEDLNNDWAMVFAYDPVAKKVVAREWLNSLSAGQQSYKLTGLLPGDYLVGLQASGGRLRWYDNATNVDDAKQVKIEDANRTGVGLTLVAATGLVTVSGQVTLPPGVAGGIDELGLQFKNLATERVYYPTPVAGNRYTVALPKGSYLAWTGRSENLGIVALSTELVVNGDTTQDFAPVQGGTLTGRIVDSAGVGVAGQVVVQANGVELAEAESDQWGYWSATALPSGPVQVRVEPGSRFAPQSFTATVKAGETIDTGNQEVGSAGRLIVAIPHQVGVDQVKVTVIVTDAQGTELARQAMWSGDQESIEGLPAGEVLVRFEGSQVETEWWVNSANRAGAQPVTIASGDPVTIEPALQLKTPVPDGTISGTLTNATGGVGTFSITVFDEFGESETTTLEADGQFSIEVEPGSYLVRAGLCTGLWMGPSGCMGDEETAAWYGGDRRASADSVTVTSNATTSGINITIGAVPEFASKPKPTVTGKVVVGSELQAQPGTFTPDPDQLSYQWLRDGAVIAGAEARSYLVTSADLNHKLSVRVIARKAGYLDAASVSDDTAAVKLPKLSGSLSLSATAVTAGQTIRAVVTGWPAGTAFTYSWKRGAALIPGQTGVSYTTSAADVGQVLAVVVRATKDGYESTSLTSGSSSPVKAVPLKNLTKGTASISGSAKVGKKLTAKVAKWQPSGISFRYQWLRNGVAIKGATKSTYKVARADKKKYLQVRIIAVKAGYNSATVVSKKTAKVK